MILFAGMTEDGEKKKGYERETTAGGRGGGVEDGGGRDVSSGKLNLH